ncbi:hypothetical protein BKA70DRAFT_1420363 [Coprinopsis sp. MPI-PUGE-AT-0042]|nr:hypothetical protein BKA70DRAFT_1420363 [Coprinopsis sp. MPI-PUGE-AT-0042]
MASRISTDTVVRIVGSGAPVIADSYFFCNIFGAGYRDECAFDSIDTCGIPIEVASERDAPSSGNNKSGVEAFTFSVTAPEYEPMTRAALEAVLFSYPVKYTGSFQPFSRPSSPCPSPAKAKIVPASAGSQDRAPVMVETHSPWVGSSRPTIAQPSYEAGIDDEANVEKPSSSTWAGGNNGAEVVTLPATACPFDQNCEFCSSF